jgi:ribulose-phosphate 3-epimerase
MIQIFPSLIGGNLLALADQIKTLDPHCAGYHLDMMDGHFVPNITWGPAFINAIAEKTSKQIWVHMMVTDPGHWLPRFNLPPHSMVDFHSETDVDHQAVIKVIRDKGWNPGIVLNPETTIDLLLPLLDKVDYVVVMSVHPGFSGQQFIAESLKTIHELAEIRARFGYSFKIGIDGGINAENISGVVNTGADYVAVASAIFDQPDPVVALQELQDCVNKK